MELATLLTGLGILLGIQFVLHLYRAEPFPNPLRNFIAYAIGLYGVHAGMGSVAGQAWSKVAMEGLALTAIAYEFSLLMDDLVTLIKLDNTIKGHQPEIIKEVEALRALIEGQLVSHAGKAEEAAKAQEKVQAPAPSPPL